MQFAHVNTVIRMQHVQYIAEHLERSETHEVDKEDVENKYVDH